MTVYLISLTAAIVLMILSSAAIQKGYKTRDLQLLWVGVLSFGAMMLLAVQATKDHLSSQPTVQTQAQSEVLWDALEAETTLNYDFGETRIMSFLDDAGRVFVVVCFNDDVPSCWSRSL